MEVDHHPQEALPKCSHQKGWVMEDLYNPWEVVKDCHNPQEVLVMGLATASRRQWRATKTSRWKRSSPSWW